MITEHPLLMHCYAIYGNSRIEVQMFKIDTAIGGVMQTTFIRHGDIAPLTWEEIQDALHELFNPETVAVEVYPALADEWQAKTNIRVLWVLHSTWPLPFGLQMASAWGKPQGGSI